MILMGRLLERVHWSGLDTWLERASGGLSKITDLWYAVGNSSVTKTGPRRIGSIEQWLPIWRANPSGDTVIIPGRFFVDWLYVWYMQFVFVVVNET